jgi:hypothetical protein
MLADLHRRLTPLRRPTPAAAVPRDHRRGVYWVDPVVIGEVAYRNWTPDGRLRHPSWRGLRPDRSVDDIRRTGPASAIRPAGGSATLQIDGAMQTPDGAWRVEAVQSGTIQWYRVIHGDNTIDWLTITDVEHLLGDGTPGAFVRPVAGAVDEDLVAGVDESIEQGLGHDRVREQRTPVRRVAVGGDDQGPAGLGPFGDQFVEVVGLLRGVLAPREVIQDQDVGSGEFGEAFGPGAVGVAAGEVGQDAAGL